MENNIYVLRKNQIINKLKELNESGASEATKEYYHGQLSIVEEHIEELEKRENKEKELDKIEIELNLNGEKLHISKHSLICKIATHIFAESTMETSNSSRYIYCDEIEECYGLPQGFIDEGFMNEVEDLLYWLYGEQIAEVEVIFNEGNEDEECDRCWSITLYHNYCVGIIEDDQAIKENRYF